MSYSRLDSQRIIETIARLGDRIRERFPAAGLGAVANELLQLARTNVERSASIRKPNWWLRAISVSLLLAGVAAIALSFASMKPAVGGPAAAVSLTDWLQTVEATLSMLFFLGAGAVYVLSLDQRSKRRRCLQALHELRAMAHIVDMHQLTKDPDRSMHKGPDTTSSPARTLTPFELVRYLDYCSEMLSLMGKVAALYVQDFPDAQAVAAVDDIENLTTGLSRKVWQKIMILENDLAAADARP
ncbi:MAG TPA: hypothetical protein VFD82_01605 [Planctomycetota bacterium]|nr:hypothetical protein [Planctomycetota bacterium]